MANEDPLKPDDEKAKAAHLNALVEKFHAVQKKNWEVIFSYDNHLSSIQHRFEVFHNELANYQVSHPDMKGFEFTKAMREAQGQYEKTYDALATTLIKEKVVAGKEEADDLIKKLMTREIPAATQPATEIEPGRAKQTSLDEAMKKLGGNLAVDMIQHKPIGSEENPAYDATLKNLILKSKNQIA